MWTLEQCIVLVDKNRREPLSVGLNYVQYRRREETICSSFSDFFYRREEVFCVRQYRIYRERLIYIRAEWTSELRIRKNYGTFFPTPQPQPFHSQ